PMRRRARIVLDDDVFTDDCLFVAACNTPYVGSGMRLAPRAETSDGKIDVVVVRQASRWQLLSGFAGVFRGTHVDEACVECYQTRSLQILAEDAGPLDLDGEVKGTTPVAIEMVPGALSFFV